MYRSEFFWLQLMNFDIAGWLFGLFVREVMFSNLMGSGTAVVCFRGGALAPISWPHASWGTDSLCQEATVISSEGKR